VQTSCPNCSNRLIVDDAKVPATPFMLKCPKCQGMVKLPGRGAQPQPTQGMPAQTPAPQVPAPAAAAPGPPAAPRPAPPASPTPPAAAPAPTPGPSAPPPAAPIPQPASPVGKALVSLPSPEQTTAVGSVLSRLRFSVEQFEPGDDRMLRLQQGEYPVIVASRNGVPEDRNAYRVVQTLPSEIRRRVFLLLVGDEYQTGEGTQAFATLADLVVNTKDAAQCDRLLTQTLHERRRVFQTFWDAEDRKVEGKL
jgi:predicted Zn finger-like uncharacterized protein